LLYERGYSRQEVTNLFRFIDWVLQLTPELEEAFDEALDQLEKEKKMTYISSLERRAIKQGREEGIQEGIQEGEIKGLRRTLMRLLQNKFGALPPTIVTYIETAEDIDHLQLLFDRILTAVSLEDMDILPHPDEP
jgi:flagellar biosynthesis/type III secretory pathway protein FliH